MKQRSREAEAKANARGSVITQTRGTGSGSAGFVYTKETAVKLYFAIVRPEGISYWKVYVTYTKANSKEEATEAIKAEASQVGKKNVRVEIIKEQEVKE